MAEVSNNTLITIVLLALAVTLLGMWVLYGRVQYVGLISNPTGYVNASVGATTDIYLVLSTVNFGSVNVGSTYDTAKNSSAVAFLLRNDGSVKVNVTLSGTALWNATGYTINVSAYRYNVTNATSNSTAASNCTGVNHNVWYTLPDSPTAGGAICLFDYVLNNNYANISIQITVPYGQAAGARASTVTLTASQG